jgi:DNA-binding NarL/FixJ family response regulator
MSATILIVEDHDAVRKALRSWLSGVFPKYNFSEATSGEEAVTLVRAQPPDIVLMDIGLPQMNGLQATRQIKAAALQTQVVILTLHEEEAYRAAAFAAGASAYVLKGKMHAELVPVVEKLLRNSAKKTRRSFRKHG